MTFSLEYCSQYFIEKLLYGKDHSGKASTGMKKADISVPKEL